MLWKQIYDELHLYDPRPIRRNSTGNTCCWWMETQTYTMHVQYNYKHNFNPSIKIFRRTITLFSPAEECCTSSSCCTKSCRRRKNRMILNRCDQLLSRFLQEIDCTRIILRFLTSCGTSTVQLGVRIGLCGALLARSGIALLRISSFSIFQFRAA